MIQLKNWHEFLTVSDDRQTLGKFIIQAESIICVNIVIKLLNESRLKQQLKLFYAAIAV